ncbi:MAG: helix-turn-helix transcriptional regulator [Bryobacteraceae bacterium]
MAPTIPDSSYCLLAAPVTGARQGKIVLVQLRDAADPETGERYTVKLYESEKTNTGDSRRHRKITLKPINPDFPPIVLSGADEGEVQVIAEVSKRSGHLHGALLESEHDDAVTRRRRYPVWERRIAALHHHQAIS